MERGKSIDSVKRYALSDADIRQVIGENVPIFPYPQLESMSSIDEAFGGKGRAIILFPNISPTIGHWCCMIRRPEGIEFFDPYGEAPEEQKGGMSKSRLEALNIDVPYLTRLFKASGLPIYYNTYPFQKDKSSIATCGRHCAVRLLYAPYSLDKYKAVIDASGLSPDDFVSGVTYDKIKK